MKTKKVKNEKLQDKKKKAVDVKDLEKVAGGATKGGFAVGGISSS